MLLEEFDEEKRAIINPQDMIGKIEDFPQTAVACFSRDTFRRIVERFEHTVLAQTSLANIEIIIYQLKIDDQSIAVFNAPVGAAACVAILEDLFAMGMKKLVLFGTCGVLEEAIEQTSIIIPTAALRDEGTSFHYAVASDEIVINQSSFSFLRKFLHERHISYRTGKVWTTDAVYRETLQKMKQRKRQGAICVDMECSAVGAWAQFRGCDVLQFFYAADHLSEEKWDIRNLANQDDLEEKDCIANLAIELAISWK